MLAKIMANASSTRYSPMCAGLWQPSEGGFACGHALIERCGAHADERKELVPGEQGEQGPLERTNAMGVELYELAEEISKARESLETGDTKTNARIDGIEKSVDALFRRSTVGVRRAPRMTMRCFCARMRLGSAVPGVR